MRLSIVTTLFYSGPHIQEFYHRMVSSAEKLTSDFELIFVNDGSPDDSLDQVVSIQQKDARVKVVDLSRNFGHHKAIMTGLSYCKGEMIFLIDRDLEEEPEWLLNFNEQMQNEKCDVIYGVQKSRKGKFFERISGRCFFWIFRIMTGMALPENTSSARLMTKRYVDALLLHKEREVFIDGLFHITGFQQQGQQVVKHNTSKSTYSLKLKLALFIDSITSFSNAPLMGIFYFGGVLSIGAATYLVYLIISHFVLADVLSGWTSVMASIWLLGGLIIMFMGTIGIYLSKVFMESKRRPCSIVRHVYEKSKELP
jgi:putative glycosyltransferase